MNYHVLAIYQVVAKNKDEAVTKLWNRVKHQNEVQTIVEDKIITEDKAEEILLLVNEHKT
jgi:hypothetical protein